MAKTKNKKIKLIQIIADSNLSGGPRHVLGILENIDKDKFDVYLICPTGHLTSQAKKIKGVEVKSVAMDSKYDLSAINNIKEILSNIQASGSPFGPMIVHTHGPRAGLLGRKAIKSGIISVYTEHRWDGDYRLENRINHWLQKKMLRSLNGKTHLVIAVSASVKDFLIEEKMVPKDRVKLIPNGINLVNVKKQATNKSSHFAQASRDKQITIGSVGNLNKEKGYEYLIGAMPKILERYPHLTLEIIGEGEERKDLKSQISDLKIEKHVTLLGRKENPAKIMKHWDVFVLPSIAETFGIVILEAYKARVPVVASRVGGIPDVVEDKKTGLLVKPKKPSSIAQAVTQLLDHPAQAAKLKRGGREKLKQFDWKKIIIEIEKEYLKLI